MTAIWVTLIIVAGIVVIALAGIGWLWATTSTIGGIPGRRREATAALQRLDSLEAKVAALEAQVNELRRG